MDHLEAAANEDNEISDDLYKFRALIGHQGPLKTTDPNWKGCKYNVLVEWETGEKTYDPPHSWQQMILQHVPHMQRKIIFYTLIAGKGSEIL